MVDVTKEIEKFDGLQALRLEGNTIGVEAAQAIAKALETKGELKVGGFTVFCVLIWSLAVKSAFDIYKFRTAANEALLSNERRKK